ncbi:MAG: bifunctional N-acetylglucosamine-1-phosphate uridyltransferase/glucosamine-1-phosphate acetyltransferase [Candidatus Omnitrophica bacterium]|nr:bifunctional N-acetylglucosamine-1-phosphate uridyltransferase/glucosamine-1-phosphate acetyltransferase [Candidatus Omnitrophota bacterium]
MRAVVLAAGKGTRMRSSLVKVLHPVMGRPMLAYVLDQLAQLGIREIVLVVGHGADEIRSFLKRRDAVSAPGTGRRNPAPTLVFQKQQRGTGHAVLRARPKFSGYSGDILIWPGDMPLVTLETLKQFLAAHHKAKPQASVLSSLQIEPSGYGRILRAGGKFFGIREELDASESEKRIQEVNSGIYLFQSAALWKGLSEIRPSNQKNEFYLTDTIEVLAARGCRLEAFPFATLPEAQGINDRRDLGEAHRMMKNREIINHQERGVTFVSPDQTFIEPGVKIGADTVIYPWCYIESGVSIGKGCQIGPFSKIRKGTTLGANTVIGSFVEVSRSKIGRKVLAKHLAYLGDAEIGDETNIGAGTITANFDGKNKNKTQIGKKVFVGSNTVFVAPVRIGDGAHTGAGAVLTKGTKVKAGGVVVGVPAKPLRKLKHS